MKSKAYGTVLMIALLALAVNTRALAQDAAHGKAEKFSGVINAYTPQNKTGPYEVRGPWSLTLKRDSGKADFSSALNMELSDGWVLTKNHGDFDPNSRDHHTHHVTLLDADVTPISTGGFQVSGMATITVNGSPAPISPTLLTIEITGGSDVEFSNIALTFGLPASKHFGTEPLSGVVRSVKGQR